MSLFDWLRPRTRLQVALRRGIDEGDLSKKLRELGEVKVKSQADAKAIAAAMKTVLSERRWLSDESASDPIHPLLALLQSVGTKEAYLAIEEHVLPVVAGALDDPGNPGMPPDDVLFALKILAMYGDPGGTDLVIRWARAGFKADSYWWSTVFGQYEADHPQAQKLFAALSRPLPHEFLAVALLDAANQFFLKGRETRHPFDSDEGAARLRAWIDDPLEDHFSYARSAVAGVPFLNHPGRDGLLSAAMAHPSAEVRLEAAWAAGKLDLPLGLQRLSEMCLDVNHSQTARAYLEELKRADLIPTEANDPAFHAKAEFANWLAHPNELGRPPDQIDIYDQRVLRWPPQFDARPFWLLRYRVRNTDELVPDDMGVGLVGSTTWCFFSYDLHQRPAEDGYALHCCWELSHEKKIEIAAVKTNEREYDHLLREWKGAAVDELQILHVAELSPELKYPECLVAIASGNISGEAGWVVLDGSRSRWYPAVDFPPDERAEMVLKLHLGRQILGLPLDAPDRRSRLQPPALIPDAEFVAAYERLLEDCEGDPSRAAAAVSRHGSPLAKHFNCYVEAAARQDGCAPAEVSVRCYRRLLEITEAASTVSDEKRFDIFSLCGECFDAYVGALESLGRAAEAMPLIHKLVPRWEHPLGYGKLGAAAFKGGDLLLAESLLLKLRNGMDDWSRCPEMSLLAEIWKGAGKEAEARDLLLGCLRHTTTAAAEAEGPDIQLYERQFQRQRANFLRLFPHEVDALSAAGIPNSTLR